MSDNFNKTVDLKQQMQPKQPPVQSARPASKPPAPARSPRLADSRRAENIDQVYRNDNSEPARYDPRVISRPAERRVNENAIRWAVAILAVIAVAGISYWLFGRDDNQGTVAGITETSRWYAIKLINDEEYYGEITDTAADPVIVENVYYNYDQMSPDKDAEDSGNLRLVKRGKETHGPDGSMEIVRTQVVFMEPLAEDSKVLKAILDYEN